MLRRSVVVIRYAGSLLGRYRDALTIPAPFIDAIPACTSSGICRCWER
jgi:hypothetical protein